MKVRSIHFDMKGVLPKAECMFALEKDFASFGYNYLLVEFEDKFPFRNYPFMHHPAAYTKAELAALNTKEMQVIPLLQSAGHLDYFLKYPQMKHLRKNGSIFQWDMSSDETFDVWCGMADEILEVYPDCEYFHIGADEADIRNEEEFTVYAEHVERCADYLIAKGKKVIMWDDMFRRHDLTKLQSIFHKVIVQVWQYREVNEQFIISMVNAGAEVWGASRVQELESYHGLGYSGPVKWNLDQWIELNSKYHLNGHTGTFWGRIHSTTPLCAPIQQSMCMIAYLGQGLSTGQIPEYSVFCQRMADWFGLQNLNIAEILKNMGHAPDKLTKLLKDVPLHREIMEIWQVLNEYDSFYEYTMSCFQSNWMMQNRYRRGDAPPKTTLNYLDGVRIIRERHEKLQEHINGVLSKYFSQSILDEFSEERFSALLELNDQQETELNSAAAAFKQKY